MWLNHINIAGYQISAQISQITMFRSKRPREILNEIKWRGYPVDECTIYYLHRGAPNDTRIVSGSEIVSLGHSFFTIEHDTSIPYHRIRRIEYGNDVVYRRNTRR